MTSQSSPILVMGHQNPDNDSICSAVGYAYLKNELEKREDDGAPKQNASAKETSDQNASAEGTLGQGTVAEGTPSASKGVQRYQAVRLGPLPPESAWVLNEYELEIPRSINHVHARVLDAMTPNPYSIHYHASLLDAGRMLRKHNVRALVVHDDEGLYRGLITTRMLAERYISATDIFVEDGSNSMAVAADLIASLEQKVDDLTETEVLTLDKEGLLKEAIEDLMASPLREALVLDDKNMCLGIVTRSDVATMPRRKVILVDHNESRQSANGIHEAEVVEIVDHHRIGDIATNNPIKFLNLPVGATATIVAMEFCRSKVEVPRGIAAALLSAILTDTILLKSPTTTHHDREQAAFLAQRAEVDVTDFGLAVFRCRGGDGDVSAEKLVGADAKEFMIGDAVVLICQYETVDLAAVMEREDAIRAYMHQLKEAHDYEFVLLMITDIIAEGSQFICEGNKRIVNRVFNISCTGSGGTWMPGVLSRKKQVAARILGA